MTATRAAAPTVTTAGITAAVLHDAMCCVGAGLAVALAEDDGIDLLGVSDFALAAAGRQPVSLAGAYSDLCAALGVAAPAWVQRAIA